MFKEELYEAYFVLQEMNDKIQKFEPISKELEERGISSIRKLHHYTGKNQKTTNVIDSTIRLISQQIQLSHEIEREKEALWKQHINPTGQKTF